MVKKIYSIIMLVLVLMILGGFFKVELLSKVSLLVEFSLTFLLLMISFNLIKERNFVITAVVIFGIAYELYYNLIHIPFEIYSMIGLMMFLPLYIILIRFSFNRNNSDICV